MSSQGLKTADPALVDTKPDRRRGAAGRAAALRRAPSDSDCSGETASLSADSGERRPPPPPPRSGKARNRRRGSEWEVLEGLKDGQRFERRPEVFNGFLHKKRKWPLKGWHKRFFVVDGGILVYARSPTDVARGRLHGSLDVGLSVISAKPRRRRIDIDADEFIYHLRAKTPDVFRTWLNVLKAHRLYRQHLLTFGARESVPKIHAPLDDLPPTDTSSRISQSSSESFSSITLSQSNLDAKESYYQLPSSEITTSVYKNNSRFALQGWKTKDSSGLIPLQPFEFSNPRSECKEKDKKSGSLCSMHCIKKRLENIHDSFKNLPIIPLSADEQQMHSTNLDLNTIKSSSLDSQSAKSFNREVVYECFPTKVMHRPIPDDKQLKNPLDYLTSLNNKVKSTIWNSDKDQTTMFFFSRKNRDYQNMTGEEHAMRRSRKSTNLVKYRNIIDEPCLRKPLVRQKILGKHLVNAENRSIEDAGVTCDLYTNGQDKKAKSTQDVMCARDYDMISEKLIFNLFNTPDEKKNKPDLAVTSSSLFVRQVVKELYDLKINDSKAHPIKFLFKTLLQYYLKNTEGKFKGSNKKDMAVTKQSNTYFTEDKKLSNTLICENKNEAKASRSTMYSIQELEQLIKSTAYISNTGKGQQEKRSDREITKALFDDLNASSVKCIHKSSDNGIRSESRELPKIQETIEHLMSDTSLSKAIAKDFLNMYRDVLKLGSNKSVISTSESSDTSKFNIDDTPSCNVQTESVNKKFSKSVTTSGATDGNVINNTDSGQIYLKEILERMTSLFMCHKFDSSTHKHDITNTEFLYGEETASDDKAKTSTLNSNKKRVYGIPKDNTIVIDLSEFDVENVSMSNHTTVLGSKCLTVNLKEKSNSPIDSKLKNLNLKFDDNNQRPNWADQPKPCYQAHIKTRNPFMVTNTRHPKGEMELPLISSSSDATSKANFGDTESDRSFGDPFTFSHTFLSYARPKSANASDNGQRYFLSSIKKDVNLIDTKKKLKELTEGVFSPQGAWRQREKKSRIIDERFILRLLENLSLLSKNIPGIHKEINNLYLKLKKRHGKDIDFSRLSLLGNIYKEKSLVSRTMLDGDTQIESDIFPDRHNDKNVVHIAINTSFLLPHLEVGLDKALSAIMFGEFAHLENERQLQAINCKMHRQLMNDNAQIERQSEFDKDEWFKTITREYAEKTAIKSMLEKYHQLPQSIRIAHPIRANIPDKSCPRNSSMTINELSFISPPLNVSYSQTKQGHNVENVEVYQIFTRNSKLVRSESMTESAKSIKNDMSDELKTIYRCTSEPSFCSGLISPNAAPIRGPQAGFVSGTPGGRLAGWIVESGGPLESASRELGQAQLSVQQLQRLLEALELQQQLHHDTDVSLEGASPNVKKDRRKFGLRKKKSNSKCASVELAPPHVDPSSSHMALSTLTAPPSPGGGGASSMPNSAASLPIACAAARPQSLPGAEALGTGPASLTSLTPDHQLREDFTVLAKDLVANLKTVVSTLVVERGRLRAALEAAEAPAPGGVVAALRTNLSSALQQNSELRSRLSRIHDASDLAEISSVGNNSDQQAARPFPQSLSFSSSCVSASEFFDAEEHDDELKPAEIIPTDEAGVIELDGDSSSEAGSISSDEGSASSDNSDGATSAVIAPEPPLQNGSEQICSRRARLPCPRPTPASPSLWNLLYKNIGKDLSQISMPVTINEPLNMLQRLCEELEYSELLDAAADCTSELERMSLIAAFAVSAYAASAHRAASKPFNPLLGETYECIRNDRDFRFLAEQVSHHPPISACHAESPRWTFWQEARIKTKFWGKSMEFQPTGEVHVRLKPSGDHYSWNKVTTCVHNLFGGQRWVDQYGDMNIKCHGTDITCKLQFIKASSWSSSRHEVRGAVLVGGAVRVRLSGRWSEGLQAGERPLWRPGAMPADYELYYGFTRFAMELNELEPGMREILPNTDTRLRPDQRALEEGDVDAAEQFKHELEQAQRERRRDGQEHSPLWFRKTMESGEEMWVFTGEYWKAREAGFTDTPRLW